MWFVRNYGIPDFNIEFTEQTLRSYGLSVRVSFIVSGMSCNHNLKHTFPKLHLCASACGMPCSCGWMQQPPHMNGSYVYTEWIIVDCQKGVVPYIEVHSGNLQIPNKNLVYGKMQRSSSVCCVINESLDSINGWVFLDVHNNY